MSQSGNRRNATQSQNGRAKNWVFTINNWSDLDIVTIETNFAKKFNGTSYVCYKKEICPNTNTRHLQGLICFESKLCWKPARSFFNRPDGSNNAWLNTMRGTIKQAKDYVFKPDSADPADPVPVEYGDVPTGQGSRTDCAAIATAIKDGATEAELLEIDPEFYLKHSTGIRRAIAISQAKRTFKTKVYWFYGPSGAGKSKLAFEISGGNAYYKNASFEFWENYQNEEFVIIDDYRAGMCSFSELLRLLDRYPHIVNIKGTYAQFNSKYIIITCPYPPEQVWKNQTAENIYQLQRRITDIVYFDKGLNTPVRSDRKGEAFVFNPDEEHVDIPLPENNTV